jgi:hypothetical protein
MSILLAILLFVRPLAIAFAILCVINIILLGGLFVVEERRGYLRESKILRDKEKAKAKLRQEKEAAAWEGFFEESFVRGFDSTGAIISRGVRVETEAATAYRKMMDRLADDKTIAIFDNEDV